MSRKTRYFCNNSAKDLKLTKDEQKSAGAFHTPKKLAKTMAKQLYPRYEKYKNKQEIIDNCPEGKDFLAGFNLLDPCCGTGNLLAAALNTYKWIEEEDIYGVDIEPEAVEFCRKKFPNGHFQVGDCLKEDITDDKFWQEDTTGLFGRAKAKYLKKQTLNKKENKSGTNQKFSFK